MSTPLTCRKAPHNGTGYLHHEFDDTPYDVDGLLYCGRCHRKWPHPPTTSTPPPGPLVALGTWHHTGFRDSQRRFRTLLPDQWVEGVVIRVEVVGPVPATTVPPTTTP